MPLFVKLPGQKRGRIDDSAARTIDIVPTIARELGIRPAWRLDGRPLGRARAEPRRGLRHHRREESGLGAALGARRPPHARAQGADSRLRDRPAVAGLPVRPGSGGSSGGGRRSCACAPSAGRVELESGSLLGAVDPSSDLLPTYVAGRVEGLSPRPTALAFAVNGRVAATAATLSRRGRRSLRRARAGDRGARGPELAAGLRDPRKGSRGDPPRAPRRHARRRPRPARRRGRAGVDGLRHRQREAAGAPGRAERLAERHGLGLQRLGGRPRAPPAGVVVPRARRRARGLPDASRPRPPAPHPRRAGAAQGVRLPLRAAGLAPPRGRCRRRAPLRGARPGRLRAALRRGVPLADS